MLAGGVTWGADKAHAQMATGGNLPVVEHELANGMRFLVLPRRGAPTTSFVVQYRVGGVNEVPGTTGIVPSPGASPLQGHQHAGYPRRGGGARPFHPHGRHTGFYSRGGGRRSRSCGDHTPAPADRQARVRGRSLRAAERVSTGFSRGNGARGLNASTDAESTTYFVELPSNRVELWFLLESDRMRDPIFREFYTERNVVAEERRLRVETQPSGLLYEIHMAESFTVHPYGQPVVGFMSDIQRLDRRRVREYYKRYYGPNNAVVAIVGDVDPLQMVEWAELYFGDLQAGDPPPPVLVHEPEQEGERRVEVVFDAEPQVRIGWHVPEEQHPGVAALSVLSALLTGGRTSRLHQRLVIRDRLATLVTSVMGPGARFPRLFTVHATTRFPHTTSEIEEAVYAELDSLRHTPPSESELQRIRNQIEAGQVRGLTSHLGLAFQLAGSTSSHGDWRTTFRFRQRLAEVRPEDVSRGRGDLFHPPRIEPWYSWFGPTRCRDDDIARIPDPLRCRGHMGGPHGGHASP